MPPAGKSRVRIVSSWSFLAIFTLFGAFSLCTVGAFLPIFLIFLGFVGIFWGTPAYFADFGAILAIFDHFWASFGPFLEVGRLRPLADSDAGYAHASGGEQTLWYKGHFSR